MRMKFQNISILLVFMQLASCSSLLYYPTQLMHYDPKKIGLSPEEIRFPSKNGESISAWYFHNTKKVEPKAIVLFYHGNGENLSSHYVSLTWLIAHEFDFMVFDYQGYGRSSGSPSPQKTIEDGAAALAYLHKTYPNKPLVIYGQSLGGAIALRNAIDLKNEFPIKLVIVDSTFSSYRSVARKALTHSVITWPFQWIGWLVMSDAYAPLDDVKEISPIPLVVIHGDHDSVVDYSLGERIFQDAREPKSFWKVPGGVHIDSLTRKDPAIRNQFLELLRKTFP